MTEKKFLSFILTEGISLLLLGILMLILPKLTSITFGMMICLGFIIYGGYKAINAFLTRNFTRHYILNIFIGLLLLSAGILLFVAPMFNLVLITCLIGIYFISESISSTAFAIQTRKALYFWWVNLLIAIFQLLLGLIILLGLPSTALWVIGVLTGINFLFAGLSMITMYISTKYIYGN